MDPREQRGIIIAALCRIDRKDGVWLVPSQSAAEKKYAVNLDQKTCSCPDYGEFGQGHTCKHIHAVIITLKREMNLNGTVTETRTLTVTEKVTYRQDWPKYNLAQQTEKRRFLSLLADLCQGIREPEVSRPKGGRPRTLMRDRVFASVLKVYTGFSSRRFATDLADAFEKGCLTKLPNSMSVSHYLEDKDMTPVLQGLIARTSLPLRAVETDFAVDSSGFSTSKFVRWFDEKHGGQRTGKQWVKAHVCCGVKTLVIAAAIIGDKDSADSPQFGPLVQATAKNFQLGNVCADKAYLGHSNLELVESFGGTPFIPFKSNSTDGGGEGAWGRMWNYFQARSQEFMLAYHKRELVESTFSMVKRKFGDSLRSKTPDALVNECLAKFLASNICVNIAAQVELGVEPVFWPDEAEADKSVLLTQRGSLS